MKKPWTLAIAALGSAKPVVIAYSAGFAPGRYWTRWGAKRAARKLNNETSHHRNYHWVPVKTTRRPW